MVMKCPSEQQTSSPKVTMSTFANPWKFASGQPTPAEDPSECGLLGVLRLDGEARPLWPQELLSLGRSSASLTTS